MKSRPNEFLSEDKISHDSEIFDYIKELHEIIWEYMRAIEPHVSGKINEVIDNNFEILKQLILDNANNKILLKEMQEKNKKLFSNMLLDLEHLQFDCMNCKKLDKCAGKNKNKERFCYAIINAAILEKENFEVPFPVNKKDKIDFNKYKNLKK